MAKEIFSVTEADLKDLTEAIEKHVKVTRGGPQETFCHIWPQAKEGLQLLNTIIKTIPGVGVFAKMAVGIVLAAGNATSSAVCK